ncbi:MAG: type II toxin-antitoxin system Phd/YefM family antitoxin [Oscillochloris sp.]|nr:type II toxin-antitoxin system Phd/YefM family antitoxin [Oscillochloris sp.]
MSSRTNLNLDVDLQRGVVPISKAASSLAALIKRAHTSGRPVIVTQKGYPTGVLLPIELFTALRALATGEDEPEDMALSDTADTVMNTLEGEDELADAEDVADSMKRRPAARRRTRADAESKEVGV